MQICMKFTLCRRRANARCKQCKRARKKRRPPSRAGVAHVSYSFVFPVFSPLRLGMSKPDEVYKTPVRQKGNPDFLGEQVSLIRP